MVVWGVGCEWVGGERGYTRNHVIHKHKTQSFLYLLGALKRRVDGLEFLPQPVLLQLLLLAPREEEGQLPPPPPLVGVVEVVAVLGLESMW